MTARFSLTPMLRALGQLDDPVIRKILLRSLGLTALAFLLLFAGGVWGLHAAIGLLLWWHAGLLGGIAIALLIYLLFLPVAAGIAVMFAEPIAATVEARWYPDLPPPAGASLAAQSWDGLALAGQVLLAHLVGLILAPLLGVGFLAGWAIAAWAMGRGLFMVVAMRRARRPTALGIYAAHRGRVLLHGALLTALAVVPVVNLLVPVLGIAMMIHLLHEPAAGVVTPDRLL